MRIRKLNVKCEPYTLNLSTYSEIINLPFIKTSLSGGVCLDAECVSGPELHKKWQETALIEAEQDLKEYMEKYLNYVQRVRHAKYLG
ncbi:MAG: hypothetical protein RL755_71 [Pseudomonadota bacterium]|jgi:hypothetical protein